LFKFKIKQNVAALGFRIYSPAKQISLSIGVAIICYLIVVALYLLFGLNPDAFYIINAVKKLNNIWYYITYSFAVIISGPFVEEIIFRGISYSPYRKKYGPLIAIILTSSLFSLIHGGFGIILIFVYGIFLGFLYEKTESIISCFLAHCILNLLLCLTAFFQLFS
jgi:membrane protease YdiL (CAAX protease family)